MTFVEWGYWSSVWIGANGQAIGGLLLATLAGILVASAVEASLVASIHGLGKPRAREIAMAAAFVAGTALFVIFSTRR